jgi:hypothetical protein
MPCHSCSLARACNRPQPFPMSMCGVAAQSDCLTCCLSACSCSPLCLEWHRLQDEDHPLRQAACCELVHIESLFRCRFEPLPRLPPARLFALAGVITITTGLNVCSVRGCKGTQISSWMSWLARRSTGTDGGIMVACFARGGGVRRPVSHALGCFRLLQQSWAAAANVRVLRQVCCHLRFGCDCSPALWSQPMILGGFDACLRRCVRLYAEHCAFRMLCGTQASNECV